MPGSDRPPRPSTFTGFFTFIRFLSLSIYAGPPHPWSGEACLPPCRANRRDVTLFVSREVVFSLSTPTSGEALGLQRSDGAHISLRERGGGERPERGDPSLSTSSSSSSQRLPGRRTTKSERGKTEKAPKTETDREGGRAELGAALFSCCFVGRRLSSARLVLPAGARQRARTSSSDARRRLAVQANKPRGFSRFLSALANSSV
ncbi:hypothetical protein MRX96_019780 [Rhipicephalus microplus]